MRVNNCETKLLERALAGDGRARGELLVGQERSCYLLALRLTGNSADAEDVCQQAFARAWRDMDSWQPVGNFRSWLLRIVVCAHRDRLDSERARRRRERSHAVENHAPAPPSQVEDREMREQLEVALGKLAEDYRLPIVLHYEQGLSY